MDALSDKIPTAAEIAALRAAYFGAILHADAALAAYDVTIFHADRQAAERLALIAADRQAAERIARIAADAPFVIKSSDGEAGTVTLQVTEYGTDYSENNNYSEDFGPNKANATIGEAKIALIKLIQARTNDGRETDPEWYAFDSVGNCF